MCWVLQGLWLSGFCGFISKFSGAETGEAGEAASWDFG